VSELKLLVGKIKRMLSFYRSKNQFNAQSLSPEQYEKWYYDRPQAKKYLQNSKIWLNLCSMVQFFQPKIVFEFSSGLGNLKNECEKRGINIISSETSSYAIHNSISKQNLVQIGEIPKCSLPFVNAAFDLVISFEVMEHVKEEYTEDVIKELNRICSGYALLTINTFDPNQPGHINMHNRKWWLEKFEKTGFQHDDKKWAEINATKYLQWDVYVFKVKGDGIRNDTGN
jgi:cyclopropane fatty-acyl-phospholipid synthase-like methyltransferase